MHTQAEKDAALKEAIKNGGFYGDNNVWNSIMVIPGDNHVYRHRVETLIINNKNVFVKKKPNGEYYLPGGSTEKDVDNEEQAINECREEARCKVKNIKFTGISYKTYMDKANTYYKDYLVKWDASYTDIYVADYDGKDHDPVENVDKDRFIESGRFYPFKECLKFFRKEHKDALLQYINDNKQEAMTESYISNYFGNLKLLKDISHNPEITIEAIDQCIVLVKKQYDQMITKSKIQRSIANGDAKNYVWPMISFEFPDKKSITVVLTFYDQFSPASASHDPAYGDIVIIAPSFFKEKKESQRYILLHEIGHIRLMHVLEKNEHKKYLFGLVGPYDNDEYRRKLMAKGKAQYIEQNADLYAILNGAKMYGIIATMYNKDYDNKYDYRATNAELANRYNSVYKRYMKLKESTTEITEEELKFIEEVKKLGALYGVEYFISTEGASDFSEVLESEDVVKKYKPKVCPKCGCKKIGVALMGEPVYICTNKDCKFVFGVVPFDENDKKAINRIKKYESCENIEDMVPGGIITETKRSELPDSVFGTSDRRYPLDTKKHVYSAIRLFAHCDLAHRAELAKAIFNAMKKYHIPMSAIGPKNKLRDYIGK